MQIDAISQEPAYGISEAAAYLKVPKSTLQYWVTGFGERPPIVDPPQAQPLQLSFLNLLECHVLAGMRRLYDLKLPRIRSALITLRAQSPSDRPLVTRTFFTDHRDLFIEELGSVLNLSCHGQMPLDYYHMHLERVEVSEHTARFFPFVVQPAPNEPKSIEINPRVGFGKPVIAGTGISTAIIASRFLARESIADLAQEYGCGTREIEEVLRWERAIPVAA